MQAERLRTRDGATSPGGLNQLCKPLAACLERQHVPLVDVANVRAVKHVHLRPGRSIVDRKSPSDEARPDHRPL